MTAEGDATAHPWWSGEDKVTPEVKNAFRGRGFESHGTGGNCRAYSQELGDGLRILVTDGDAFLPATMEDSYWLTIDDESREAAISVGRFALPDGIVLDFLRWWDDESDRPQTPEAWRAWVEEGVSLGSMEVL